MLLLLRRRGMVLLHSPKGKGQSTPGALPGVLAWRCLSAARNAVWPPRVRPREEYCRVHLGTIALYEPDLLGFLGRFKHQRDHTNSGHQRICQLAQHYPARIIDAHRATFTALDDDLPRPSLGVPDVPGPPAVRSVGHRLPDFFCRPQTQRESRAVQRVQ